MRSLWMLFGHALVLDFHLFQFVLPSCQELR